MVREKETKTRGVTREEFQNRAKEGMKLEIKSEKVGKSSLGNLKTESENESEEEQFEIEEILDSKKNKRYAHIQIVQSMVEPSPQKSMKP